MEKRPHVHTISLLASLLGARVVDMTMTVIEFAKLGGKARWKDKTKEERSAHMQALAKRPRKSRRKLSTVSKQAS